MGGLATAGAQGGCTSPSSGVDGGDLLGVFDRDAGARAAASGSSGKRPLRKDGGTGQTDPPAASGAIAAHPPGAAPPASGKPQGDSAPGVSVRPPALGTCVEAAGLPDRDVRRTLGRPACRDAQVLEWQDAEGAPRYACVIAPKGIDTRAPLPLIIFFHGPLDDPTSVDKKTGLRKLGGSFNLTGDLAHTGFVVLAPQGRALKGSKLGSLFDTSYTGADHVDVAAVDAFVDVLDRRGHVDRRRIYALGNSFGGHMAATYAMMRADRVAAFASYGSDAPSAAWSCPGPPPPAMVLYRACDEFTPCESVERWLRARDAMSAESAPLRLGMWGEEEPSCAFSKKCTKIKGTANHRRWPKAREAEILRFFARHALAPPP
jgi:poly(3-hydroxybutyrate) depolymerase